MSQDYTVAKELASLKEIKQSAEQRISELSLNALNYVDDHRLHKADGGRDGSTGVGVLVCNETIIDGSLAQLDKTVSEILDAFPNVVVKFEEGRSYSLFAVSEFNFDEEDGYQILFASDKMFTAQNLNDYPTHG